MQNSEKIHLFSANLDVKNRFQGKKWPKFFHQGLKRQLLYFSSNLHTKKLSSPSAANSIRWKRSKDGFEIEVIQQSSSCIFIASTINETRNIPNFKSSFWENVQENQFSFMHPDRKGQNVANKFDG